MTRNLNLYINEDYRHFHGLEEYLIGANRLAKELSFNIHLYYSGSDEIVTFLSKTETGSSPIGILGFDPVHHGHFFQTLNGYNRNYLIINKHLSTMRNISSISIDYIKAAKDITNHMLKNCRCKKIACLGFDPHSPLDQEKLQGHQLALSQSLIPWDNNHIYYNQTTSVKTIQRLLHQITTFDGILASTDAMGILFLNQAKSLGIRIPEDLVLASFDGLWLGKHLLPTITTASPNYQDIGETTVKLASFMIETPKIQTLKAICNHRLYIGQSTHTNLSAHRSKERFSNFTSTVDFPVSKVSVTNPTSQIFSELEIESIEHLSRLFSNTNLLETKILKFLLEGLYYKEISSELEISERMVKYHVKRMLDSINLTSQKALKNLFYNYLTLDAINWDSLFSDKSKEI